MDMTTEDRNAFAERLRYEQAKRFESIAKAAYTAAKVNSATWSRATTGQTIKPHKVHQIVANLWPETQGDWTRIPSVGGGSEDSSYVASPGESKESGMADDQVLREIRAMREDTKRRLEDLSERVAKLEQPDP